MKNEFHATKTQTKQTKATPAFSKMTVLVKLIYSFPGAFVALSLPFAPLHTTHLD